MEVRAVDEPTPSEVMANNMTFKQVLMTTDVWKFYKNQIWKTLANPTDPAPQVIAVGDGDPHENETNVRKALQDTTCEEPWQLKRGFKIYSVHHIEDKNNAAPIAWHAVVHFVLACKDATDPAKWKLRCVTKDERIAPDGVRQPFIFVTSSRVETTMTDREILTGNYHFGEVLGGWEMYVSWKVELSKVLQNRRLSYARSPERIQTKRKIVVFYLPYYVEWWEERKIPDQYCDVLGELMGFGFVECGSALESTVGHCISHQDLYWMCANNSSKLVDAEATIDLINNVHKKDLSYEEEKKIFFDHYDQQRRKISALLDHRTHTRYTQMCRMLDNKMPFIDDTDDGLFVNSANHVFGMDALLQHSPCLPKF